MWSKFPKLLFSCYLRRIACLLHVDLISHINGAELEILIIWHEASIFHKGCISDRRVIHIFTVWIDSVINSSLIPSNGKPLCVDVQWSNHPVQNSVTIKGKLGLHFLIRSKHVSPHSIFGKLAVGNASVTEKNIIQTWISNLVHTASFWNNLHHVC